MKKNLLWQTGAALTLVAALLAPAAAADAATPKQHVFTNTVHFSVAGQRYTATETAYGDATTSVYGGWLPTNWHVSVYADKGRTYAKANRTLFPAMHLLQSFSGKKFATREAFAAKLDSSMLMSPKAGLAWYETQLKKSIPNR